MTIRGNSFGADELATWREEYNARTTSDFSGSLRPLELALHSLRLVTTVVDHSRRKIAGFWVALGEHV